MLLVNPFGLLPCLGAFARGVDSAARIFVRGPVVDDWSRVILADDAANASLEISFRIQSVIAKSWSTLWSQAYPPEWSGRALGSFVHTTAGPHHHPPQPDRLVLVRLGDGNQVGVGNAVADSPVETGATGMRATRRVDTFEAAIPITIMAIGLSARKKNALQQNVMIQSIGAASGVVVAGAIFTLPGIYILGLAERTNFLQMCLASLLGGFLGILMLIPFRRYFVKDMHGEFPFPEATASTEVLMAGVRSRPSGRSSSRSSTSLIRRADL